MTNTTIREVNIASIATVGDKICHVRSARPMLLLTATVGGAKSKFERMNPRFDSLKSKFERMNPRFDSLKSKFERTNPRFDSARRRGKRIPIGAIVTGNAD